MAKYILTINTKIMLILGTVIRKRRRRMKVRKNIRFYNH